MRRLVVFVGLALFLHTVALVTLWLWWPVQVTVESAALTVQLLEVTNGFEDREAQTQPELTENTKRRLSNKVSEASRAPTAELEVAREPVDGQLANGANEEPSPSTESMSEELEQPSEESAGLSREEPMLGQPHEVLADSPPSQDACWRKVGSELQARAVARVPRALRGRGLKGEVVLRFGFDPRGLTRNVRVEARSGSALLEDAARSLLVEPFGARCSGEGRWVVTFGPTGTR
ncbi:energy transducer TonB [Myxococcota bacterium]